MEKEGSLQGEKLHRQRGLSRRLSGGKLGLCRLIALGLSMTGIAMGAVPLSVIWLVLSIWLARRQERAEHESDIEY
jgi:hypothetical protein